MKQQAEKNPENIHTGFDLEAFVYAIIEQAVKDYKALHKAGVIVDGKVVDQWPAKDGNNVRVTGIKKRHEAVELIHFFEKLCSKLLESLGSGLTGQDLLNELKIKVLTEPFENLIKKNLQKIKENALNPKKIRKLESENKTYMAEIRKSHLRML